MRAKNSKRVKVVCFAFWCIFYGQNLFVKKNKQARNCPGNLIYYTTERDFSAPKLLNHED